MKINVLSLFQRVHTSRFRYKLEILFASHFKAFCVDFMILIAMLKVQLPVQEGFCLTGFPRKNVDYFKISSGCFDVQMVMMAAGLGTRLETLILLHWSTDQKKRKG